MSERIKEEKEKKLMIQIKSREVEEARRLAAHIKCAFPDIDIPYPEQLIVIVLDYNDKNLDIVNRIKNDPLVSHLKVEAWELTPI